MRAYTASAVGAIAGLTRRVFLDRDCLLEAANVEPSAALGCGRFEHCCDGVRVPVHSLRLVVASSSLLADQPV